MTVVLTVGVCWLLTGLFIFWLLIKRALSRKPSLRPMGFVSAMLLVALTWPLALWALVEFDLGE